MNIRKNRKAISPVLATVILIAITLIAAIAIAGFVFGLFGSFTSSAQVSLHVSSCTNNGGAPGAQKEICTLSATNSGTSNAAFTACSIQVAGVAQAGTVSGTTGVNAGTTVNGVICTTTAATLTEPTVGSQAVGSVAASNGASVPFTGVWT